MIFWGGIFLKFIFKFLSFLLYEIKGLRGPTTISFCDKIRTLKPLVLKRIPSAAYSHYFKAGEVRGSLGWMTFRSELYIFT